MKLTGERPMEGQTPDSLLALHAAGYREVRARVGSGRMLDLGCGLADGTVGFAAADRMLIGVDYDQETAASAVKLHPDVDLRTVCSDGAKLPLRTASFDDVCSSHLIEHFVDPEFHVAEVARVLNDDGRAFFLTPNEPADFENPYHVYLFSPEDLQAMLGRHFNTVTSWALMQHQRSRPTLRSGEPWPTNFCGSIPSGSVTSCRDRPLCGFTQQDVAWPTGLPIPNK